MPEKRSLPQITVGYTVGKLTVKEASNERKSGYIVWKCVCICGNDVLLDTRTLQRRTVKDCGCETVVHPGQKDLTGIRFGNLVCLAPTDERGKRGGTIWKCQCDCGNTCLADIAQLTNGYKKSCGCLSHPPLKDYLGKHFHMLEVIGYAGKRAGMHHWECVCECGRKTIVGQTLLQSGKTKSCGCLQATIILKNLKLCEGTAVAHLKKRKLKNNKSGYTGVYQTRNGRWSAQITFKGKTYYLGSYDKIQDAVKARQRAEEMHDDFIEYYNTQREDDLKSKRQN